MIQSFMYSKSFKQKLYKNICIEPLRLAQACNFEATRQFAVRLYENDTQLQMEVNGNVSAAKSCSISC